MDKQNAVSLFSEIGFSHKWNKALTGALTQMNLEHVMLRERRQTQKATQCTISFIRNARVGKSTDTERRCAATRAWGGHAAGMSGEELLMGTGSLSRVALNISGIRS